MRRLLLFSLIAMLLGWPKAQAEYRVFELVLKKKDPSDNRALTERILISNLDPDQFAAFYPVNPGESITYRKTWMCRGRTDQSDPYCLKDQKPSEKPAEQ